MGPEMISSLHNNTAEQNVTTNDNYVQPLMICTWSQTTSDEVLHLNATDQTDREKELEKKVKELRKQIRDQLKREKELEEEVKELRKQIREHLKREKELEEKVKELRDHLNREEELDKEVEELMKVKRDNSEQVPPLDDEEQQPLPSLSSSPSFYCEISLNSEDETLNTSQYPGVICNKTPQISPNVANNPTSHTTSSNSVISIPSVADGNAGHNGELIEIQLVEEDGAKNLNNSTDSGRSEINLEPEHSLKVNSEQPVSAPSEHNVLKRRKLYKKKQRRRPRDGSSHRQSKRIQNLRF